MKVKDISNQKFGNLSVVEYIGIGKEGRAIWKCKCICGNFVEISGKHLRAGQRKSCGCLHHKSKELHQCWTGHKQITGKYWACIKLGAKKRNFSFNLTKEEAWFLLEKQNFKCYFTGWDLVFQKDRFDKKGQTASIDRIDNNKGYSIDNIRWVHKDINKCRQNFTDEYFLEICKTISENINVNKNNKR